MYRRMVSLCCIMVLVSIIIGGCSNSLKDENARLMSQTYDLRQKNSLLENKNIELDKMVKDLKNKSEALNNKFTYFYDLYGSLDKKLFENNDDLHAVYIGDDYTLERITFFWIYIPNNLSIKQKLQILANSLSQTYFYSLPIEIVKIEESSSKKIAVINLKETKDNQGIKYPAPYIGKSWGQSCFQGSTGGSITSTSLIETFLQNEYGGEWIDGVRFLYNGGPLMYDHVPDLGRVTYRTNTR